jgi:hypothetical protein
MLVHRKGSFTSIDRLADFPFDEAMLSCRIDARFPDMAIRLSHANRLFSGGELIELKDSKSDKIPSFNSTIPQASKRIDDLIQGNRNIIRSKMEEAGDDPASLPIRDVYYLVRGRFERRGAVKAVLVHGSFFETISVKELIASAFQDVIGSIASEDYCEATVFEKLDYGAFADQSLFSQTRHIEGAAVTLRFRIMTEVNKDANLLNSTSYPEIKDNTLNLLVPCEDHSAKKRIMTRVSNVFSEDEIRSLRIFRIRHLLNGYYIVFQVDL